MRVLVDQLEQSLNAQLYYLSLFTALAIPDIAGAFDSADGTASGKKYAEWYEKWVRPRFAESVRALMTTRGLPSLRDLPENPLTGDACYIFRCSLIHQGRTQHQRAPFERILFIEPGTTDAVVIHYHVIDKALMIDVKSFCREIVDGARLWLDAVESTPLFQKNYDKFARRHREGMRPYIVGVPVVG